MKLARLVALVALPLLVAGCSGTDGTPALEKVLVEGVWRVERFYTEMPNGTIQDATSRFNGYRYTFYEDGYVVSRSPSGRVRGTWGAAEIAGRPAFGISIPDTPMFFGRTFVWWVESVEETMVTLRVEDPHVSVTRLVFLRI